MSLSRGRGGAIRWRQWAVTCCRLVEVGCGLPAGCLDWLERRPGPQPPAPGKCDLLPDGRVVVGARGDVDVIGMPAAGRVVDEQPRRRGCRPGSVSGELGPEKWVQGGSTGPLHRRRAYRWITGLLGAIMAP